MKKFFMSAAFVCFAFWFGGFLAFSHKIYHYPRDTKTKTDAIVVLTGGRYRIKEAVDLLDRGLSDKLLISGVEKNISLQAISKHQRLKIPEGREVQLDSKSTNTVENAIESAEWIEKNNIKSIRLVTSNYHTPRSLEEFYIQNPKVKIIPHPVYSDYVRKRWWRSFRTFFLVASEYNKFLYVYWARRLKIKSKEVVQS